MQSGQRWPGGSAEEETAEVDHGGDHTYILYACVVYYIYIYISYVYTYRSPTTRISKLLGRRNTRQKASVCRPRPFEPTKGEAGYHHSKHELQLLMQII